MSLNIDSNLWEDNSLRHQNNATAWLRILVLVQVALSGLAYGQVEVPLMVYTAIGYLTAFVYLIYFSRVGNLKNAWLLIIPFAFFMVNLLWSIGEVEAKPSTLYTILIAELLLLDSDSKIWVYQKYRIFIVLMCAAGAICYVSYVARLGLPFSVRDYYTGHGYYINYHIAYVISNGSPLSARLCGLFNEPGFLGTISAMILVIERLNLRKIGNLIIFIACLFTFSLAFWVIIGIYFLVTNLTNRKRMILALAAVAVIIVGFINIPNIHLQNRQANRLIHRLEFKDGKLAGDNRTEARFDLIYSRFMKSDNTLLGLGPNAMRTYNLDNTSSYKVAIFRYGYLGFFILWSIPLVCAIRYSGRDKRSLIFVLCFFASTYQRPDVYLPCYMCLLFGGMSYIQRYEKLKLTEHEDNPVH